MKLSRPEEEKGNIIIKLLIIFKNYDLRFSDDFAQKTESLNLLIPEIKRENLKLNSELLGKGTFGNVHSGSWDSIDVAVKTLKRIENLNKKSILREAAFLARVHHANTTQISGICIEDSYLHFHVKELIQGQNLCDIIYTFNQSYNLSELDEDKICLDI